MHRLTKQLLPPSCRPIIFGLLAIWIATVAGFLVLVTRSGPATPHAVSPLLNPLRKAVNPDDLIVALQPLRERLNEITAPKGENVSVYFEMLQTGANISINKEADVWPVSVMRVPVALAVLKNVETGKWPNGATLTLKEGIETHGLASVKDAGTNGTASVDALLEAMLVQSDPVANLTLLEALEPPDLFHVYEHLGLKRFYGENSKIGAKYYVPVFRALYNATYLNEEHSSYLLKLLGRTPPGGYLGEGVPEKVFFARRLALDQVEGTLLDGGIVYVPGRPYTIVFMTKGMPQEEASAMAKEISHAAYDFVTSYAAEQHATDE